MKTVPFNSYDYKQYFWNYTYVTKWGRPLKYRTDILKDEMTVLFYEDYGYKCKTVLILKRGLGARLLSLPRLTPPPPSNRIPHHPTPITALPTPITHPQLTHILYCIDNYQNNT